MVAYRRLAFVGFLFGAAALVGVGWLWTNYPPEGVALLGFFPLAFVAVSGLACVLVSLLTGRFAGPGHLGDAFRQSVWVGLVVTICIWLIHLEAFSWPVAILLAMVFLLVELFIRRMRGA